MKLERYISPKYLKKQQWLHDQPKGYGGRGDKWAGPVKHMLRNYHCQTMLDYGCGQGTLVQGLQGRPNLPVTFYEYDPAIPGKDYINQMFFDLVVCTDVLEHVEPDKLPIVIDHLFRLTGKILFLVIATRPSNKWFPNGQNAHLIIEPESWWKERVCHPHFHHVEAPSAPDGLVSREIVWLLQKQEKQDVHDKVEA